MGLLLVRDKILSACHNTFYSSVWRSDCVAYERTALEAYRYIPASSGSFHSSFNYVNYTIVEVTKMTKDELIIEINNCSSFCAFCYDGSTINIIAENLENSIGHPENFMMFSDDVEYLEDISVNWEALKTAKNRSLGNVHALLNLINDYVNTPIEQRSLSQQKKNSFDKNRKNIRATTSCYIDESAGPIYELPQRGVIITLDDGRELHGKRPYDDICISDFEDTAINFGNFIIPTAIIRSIQKCGD